MKTPDCNQDAMAGFDPVSLFGDAANLKNWVKLMDAVTDKMIARGDILDDIERLQARNAIWEALTLINSKSPNDKGPRPAPMNAPIATETRCAGSLH
jgi:hypothetical protein